AAQEAVAHHQVVALAQPDEEVVEVGEIVAVVAIAHDDVAPARCADSGEQRAAVAAGGDVDYTRAPTARDLLRAIGAAVVGDDDLAVDARIAQIPFGLLDAGSQRFRLVEARHQDRQLGHGLLSSERSAARTGGAARRRCRASSETAKANGNSQTMRD